MPSLMVPRVGFVGVLDFVPRPAIWSSFHVSLANLMKVPSEGIEFYLRSHGFAGSTRQNGNAGYSVRSNREMRFAHES